jgi:gliding motility-associated-like protein
LKPYHINWKDCGEIHYYSQNFSGTAYFADNGIGFGFQREVKDSPADRKNEHSDHTSFFLEFIGKNSNAKLSGENQQVAVFNYYHGESHVSGVKTYSNIAYAGLYNHIDLKYSCEGDGLKFDYILHPGAKIKDIQLQYNGVKNTAVNKAGDLEILTDWGILTDKKPYSYQIIDGQKKTVEVSFKKNAAGRINFEITGKYNSNLDLIIDPYTLTWGTYIGGKTAGSDGYHYDITMDNQGNIYGAGWYAPDFPMVNAASTNASTIQPFVYKMSPDGTTLLFATYCGGDANGDDEIGSAVAVNPAGDVFLCGYTNNATNFPKAGTPVRSTIAGGADIFVARFTATGALVFTTFYGGPGDDRAYDIGVDASNNIFITGFTASTSGFASAGAFQSTFGGGAMDAFLLKLNYTGSAVSFCTYFGGTGQDLGRGLAVDLSGNVYVGGATESTSGISTAGSFKASYGGGSTDGFIAKFSNGGSQIYGAYVGGTMGDKVESVVAKCNGEIVISGWTYSASNSFPPVNAIQPENGTGNPIDGGRDGFMCRITANGAKKLNSTYIGGPSDDANKNGAPFNFSNQQLSTCVSVNRLGNIAFCMNTNNALPVVNPTKAAPTGNNAYLFITDTAGSKRIFATYFGGDERDYPTGGIKYHPKNDNVFVLGGSSHSSDGSIQMTPGTYMPLHGSPAGGATGQDQPYLVLFTNPVCTMKVTLPVPAAVCKNTSITFTADTVCGGKSPSFKWLLNGVVLAGETGISFTSTTLNNGDNVCVVFSKAIPTCIPTLDSVKACVSVVITPPPTLTFSQINVKCKGDNTGSITVSGASGTAPYTYSKDGVTFVSSGVFNGLTAGVYSITVKDAKNCSNSQTITITEPPALVVSATSTNVNCNGTADGTATSQVSGGFPSYTYSWNTSPVQTTANINALNPGTYVLTVTDANSCSKTASVTIATAPALIATATSTDVTCNGTADGTATVAASGGTSPYTYSWNSSPVQTGSKATSLAAGTYIVSVTDAKNCVKTATATVGNPLTLSASATATNGLCGAKDGSVSVTASGGVAPYSYSWNTAPVQTTASVTGLGPGNYTVSVKDANGCSKTASALVSSSTGITATTATAPTKCTGSSDGSATVTASGGNPPYTYSWNTTPAQTTTNATGLSAGIYSVNILDTKGCTYTASATVGSAQDIVVSIKTVNTSCNASSDGSATATVSGGAAPYSFSWNSSPVQSSAMASNLSSGAYVVTVTDSKGCVKNENASIASPPALTANAVATDISCNGSADGTTTVTAGGGTGPYTYSWNTSPVQTTATAIGLGAGTYTATVKDASGCIQTASATVIPPLVLSVSVTSTNILCGSSNGSATASASGGTAPYSYSWSSSPVQTTPTASGLSAGTYIVKATDSKGCSKTANATISSASGLLASPSAVPAKCNGSLDGSISANGTGGTPPYSYSWSTTPIQTTSSATGLGAGNYTLTLTDSKGCTFSTSSVITEPPVLKVSTSTTKASCYGSGDGSATAIVSGGTTPYSYSWNTTTIQTTATASALAPGTYVVTITDANACVGKGNATVDGPPALVVATTVTNVTCNGAADGKASVKASGGTAGYTYSIDGTTFVTNALFTNIAVGNYTITVRDANGCQSTNPIVVNQPSKLTATKVITDVLCFGFSTGSIQITAADGTGPYIYSIDGLNYSQNGTFSNLGQGNYSIVVKDANACPLNVPASIGSAPALVIKVVSETDMICTTPGNISINGTGGKGPYLYSLNGGSYGSAAVFNNLDTGKYTLKVKDANGCIQSVDTVVHPYKSASAVVVTINGSTTICSGQTVELVSDKLNGNVWYPNGETTKSIFVSVSGTYYVVAPDQFSCPVKSNKVNIQLLPKPDVKPGKGTEICAGTATQLGSDPVPGYSYSWTSEPSGFISSLANPMVQPAANIKYRLTVNNKGCMASDTVSITVKGDPEIFIPNSFTPNGDGLNDKFKVSSDQPIELTGTIFNRWGEKIFEWNTLDGGWDGISKSETNQLDVFVYIINGKGRCSKTTTRMGTVTIVK